MTHGSLFSGIGGFDLAAEWMGWQNIFHCEWNEFGQKVLKYYWPEADSYSNIIETDFKKYANRIDVLTGGFPCQPFSLAGKRKGKEDERYLWHEMLRAIQEIKPKFVIAENVYGITNIDGGMVFEQVCIDLENEGYEVQPFIIPASSKNAPHKRDRVWFIANSSDCRDKRHTGKHEGTGKEERLCEWHKIQQLKKSTDVRPKMESSSTNSNKKRLQRGKVRFKPKERTQSNDQQFKGFNKFSRQEWKEFPTESPICSGNDGISERLDNITFSKWRTESIKAYGNAIVPQVAFELFKAL